MESSKVFTPNLFIISSLADFKPSLRHIFLLKLVSFLPTEKLSITERTRKLISRQISHVLSLIIYLKLILKFK